MLVVCELGIGRFSERKSFMKTCYNSKMCMNFCNFFLGQNFLIPPDQNLSIPLDQNVLKQYT